MKTEITTTVTIGLSVDQLADLFIRWSDIEQGEFLSKIGEHFKKADFNAEMQVCYIADKVSSNGRDFIFTLANFLKARSVSSESPKFEDLINKYEPCDLY